MLAVLLLLGQTIAAPRPVPSTRTAVERALPALERSAKTFVANRSCVSCHHNILPILTLRLAASRGFTIDAAVLENVERKTFRELTMTRAFDEAVQGAGVGDPTPNDSWLLVAAQVAGLAPDPTNAIYAKRIASWQHDGHWTTSDFRPPHSSSLFTATATAVRAIRAYMPDEMRQTRERVVADASRWLQQTAPQSTEDATFRVLGLVWAGAPRDVIAAAAADLQKLQRLSGGWAQLPGYRPDAYSTGEALYALSEAGASDTMGWRRGIVLLRSTQAADGTWRVPTRMISPAEVSPPYFETGFPYKKDEFLSYAGSSWATMALLSALPQTTTLPPRPKAAASQAASEVSPLMLAMPDLAQVTQLIANGADVHYRTPAGYDAVTVAASYRGTTDIIRALLDAGAAAEPPDSSKAKHSPLLFASMSGDLETVSLLLARGAKANPRPNPSGDSPISEAITFGRADVVRALVAAGAKVDLVESTGVNLLHWATITNRAEVIPVLAKAGVDINAIDEAGFTPLMYAATIDFGDTSTLRALLAAGADKTIKNASGRTARQQAQHFGHTQLAIALQ